ncbi:MAG: class I SAM-dependent methyltransferase [Planctomycetota bacterium]
MTEKLTLDKGGQRERQVRGDGSIRRFFRELSWLTKSDSRLYWLYRLTGRSFTDYYAARMDRIAKEAPQSATGRPQQKRFQMEYLIDQGMQPDSHLLDFGCGTGSAAVSLVDYLDSDRYLGADISEHCVELARQRMVDEQLFHKNARFVHLDDQADRVIEGTFDFIWAQSVLTHVPPVEMAGLLRSLAPLLRESGRFYATFAFTDGKPVHYRYKDWFYHPSFFDEVCEGLPIDCRIMTDWRHPNAPIDRMVCFTPAPATQGVAA